MALLVRDNVIFTPRVSPDANSAIAGQVIDSLAIPAGATQFFTEAIDVGTFSELIAFLDTLAQAGTTPTLDVSVQYGYKTSAGKFRWIDSGDSFTQVTTTLSLTIKKLSANFGKYIRFKLLLGGTNPAYTISLKLAEKA